MVLPLGPSFATSVVPGWHTVIFSPYFVASLAISIFIILPTRAYWQLRKSPEEINWLMFALHLFFTIPIVIFLRFPGLFLPTHWQTFDEFEKQNQWLTIIAISFVALFVIGQFIFAIQYFKARKLRFR
jgi:hypothetical protein